MDRLVKYLMTVEERQIKKLTVIGCLIVALCLFVTLVYAMENATDKEPTGYYGYNWGSAIDTVNMSSDKSDPENSLTWYSLRFGEYPIFWGYTGNKLASVIIGIRKGDFENQLHTYSNRYGNPQRSMDAEYIWNLPTVKITMKDSDGEWTGYALYVYKPLVTHTDVKKYLFQ